MPKPCITKPRALADWLEDAPSFQEPQRVPWIEGGVIETNEVLVALHKREIKLIIKALRELK